MKIILLYTVIPVFPIIDLLAIDTINFINDISFVISIVSFVVYKCLHIIFTSYITILKLKNPWSFITLIIFSVTVLINVIGFTTPPKHES